MNREERRLLEKQVKKANKDRKRYGMKTYDITEKMDFSSSPKMKVKDITVTVNTDAKAVIKAVDLMDKQDSIASLIEAYELLFSENEQKKIDKLKLNPNSFVLLVRTALTLALGNDPDEEEEKNE